MNEETLNSLIEDETKRFQKWRKAHTDIFRTLGTITLEEVACYALERKGLVKFKENDPPIKH